MTDTPPAEGSSALLGPEALKAALQTATAATQELESALQVAATEAYQRWHAKWQLHPDSIHIKGERLGRGGDQTCEFESNVKLRWELA